MEIMIMARTWLKRRWPWLAVAFLVVCFFAGAASYNYFLQKNGSIKWLSPDETANYVFSKLYGQTGEMTIFEKYNLISGDIIHPRSFGSSEGVLGPVSFLGIILIYGSVIGLTSYKLLPFLTPSIAGLGILFFYLLLKKIFGRRNALISVFILAVFPPYFYYSARSMFHNILFTALLIIGLYFAMLMAERKKAGVLLLEAGSRSKSDLSNWIFSALAGLFLGLAIITRASELIWLAPVLLIIWLFNLKKIGFTRLVIFLSFLFLSILPNLYWNQILYGAPLSGGYPEMNQSIKILAETSRDLIKTTATGELAYHREIVNRIKNAFFYFGFKPKQSFKMLYYYFVKMFPWIFWPFVLGFFLFLRGFNGWKKKQLVYLIAYVFIFLVLLFYYGSWKFNDNPDPGSFTIGNSYTRYWLPIYLGAIPFASIFLMKLTRVIFSNWPRNEIQSSLFDNVTITDRIKEQFRFLKSSFLIKCGRVILLAFIYFFSVSFILFGSEEGLIYAFQNQKKFKFELEKVLASTESDAVIITRYHDKIFFPERKVIVGAFDDYNLNSHYAQLAGYLPLYCYNFTFPVKDLEYLNNKRLKEVNLRIEETKKITSDFTLYKLTKTE